MGMYAKLENEPDENKSDITPIVVFMAFSVEAYLNSVGYRVADYWNNIERNNWRDKIEILHKISNKEYDWGKEPLQFISSLFKLRDKLAHGKPEKIIEELKQTKYDRAKPKKEKVTIPELLPEWYKNLNKEWAISAKEKFHESMVYLGSLHDFDESDHLHHSSETIETEEEIA